MRCSKRVLRARYKPASKHNFIDKCPFARLGHRNNGKRSGGESTVKIGDPNNNSMNNWRKRMENDKVAKEKKPSKSRKRGQGEGSIFQRSDGRWCAAMVVGYRDGRPRRKHFYGETRSDVADRLTRALQELQQGIIPADDRIKLDAFLDHWLEDTVKPSVRPKTYDSYKQLARLYLKPDLGHVRLSKLTPHDVRKFMNAK